MVKKLKIGFIGCGRAAQTVHLPYFASSDQCEIVTLVDRRSGLAAKIADYYGIPRVSGDYRVLCDDPGIDAVVMILREPLHAPVAIDLMRSGKHVFTEKPISDTHAGAQAMAATARETGRLLMVGYMRRYDPGIQIARRLIEQLLTSGSAGRITSVRIQHHGGGTSPEAYGAREPVTTDEEKPTAAATFDDGFPERIQRLSYGTNFFDTHLTDMLLYLLDPVQEVLFADMQPDPPSRMFIYKHRAYKTVHTGGFFGRGPNDECLTVYFEKGRLRVWPSVNFLRDVHAQVELVLTSGAEPYIRRPIVEGTWCFKAQAEDLIRCVQTGDRPRCTAEDALADARLMLLTNRKLAEAD